MVKQVLEQMEQTSRRHSTTSESSGIKSLNQTSIKISKPKREAISSGLATQTKRKKRVLHVAGSGVSKYYESVSLIYGLPSYVHGPREEFEHIFAKISLNEETGKINW